MSKAQSRTATTASPKAAAPAAAATQSKVSSITPEQRECMIAEAAYYRAEHRGFQSGDPQQDWLEAEAEIDQMLGGKLH